MYIIDIKYVEVKKVMKLDLFYQIEMPVSVARVIMKQTGDKGDPKTLVMKIPTNNLSHDAFDEFLYGKEVFKLFLDLLHKLVLT